jgi:two-component system NtrC family sensor kinase
MATYPSETRPAGLPAPAAAGAETRRPDVSKERFARLKRRLVVGMLAAFIAPILILSYYFHFQFTHSLTESGKLHLLALAESQRNTIDLFLQERVFNIFGLFYSAGFSLRPNEAAMQTCLQNLRQMSDAFIDVGFFDQAGIQVGYAGRYPFLHGRDYSREKWFLALNQQARNYYISDIYLGFRNQPHFTIAVKQVIDGRPFIIRATLDPDKFYIFLNSISREKGVESYLINAEGFYQVAGPEHGKVMEKSGYLPPSDALSGVDERSTRGEKILKAFTRLKETPWTLVVRQPMNIAYAGMIRARTIIIAATALIIVTLTLAIWLIVRRLIDEAEATARSREELRYQLIHAAKLASVGELAAGVAHEINNPLQIISANAGVIRDFFDPTLNLTPDPKEIEAELDQIDTAVFRARGITKKLMDYARKHEPRLSRTNLNQLLDEVVGGLKEREFLTDNIRLIRDYDLELPELMLDRDELSQVFLNLINNAGDSIVAAGGGGAITLSTRRDHDHVRIAVIDSGTGMEPELLKKIFLPFFTTREVGKGTGLGLPVSLSIVESMGGAVEVQSVPGSGSSFTVVLSIKDAEAADGGARTEAPAAT